MSPACAPTLNIGFRRLTRCGRLTAVVVLLAGLIVGYATGCSDDEELLDQAPTGDDDERVEVGEPKLERHLTAEQLAAFAPPPVVGPTESLAELRQQLQSGTEVVTGPDAADITVAEVLAAAPFDVQPTVSEVAAFGDGFSRTPSGRLIVLDEPAALACAAVEQALWSLEDDGAADVSDRLREAVRWVEGSDTSGMADWVDTLSGQTAADDPDVIVLVAFLRTCIDGGYEV